MKHTNIAQIGQAEAIRSDVEIITPEQARWLRDNAHFDRQRNISKANVLRLAHEMAKGRFIPGAQLYLCRLPSGRELVINGNHTLEAIHASGIPQTLTVTRHPVSDMDEAGRVYAVFDNQKARSWADSLRATAGEDVPAHGPSILSALGVIDRGFVGSPQGMQARLERIEMMEDYRGAVDLWLDAVRGAHRSTFLMMKRAAVMAVALETLRYQPHKAAAFWHRVANDNGLTIGMPERALLVWLRGIQRGSGTSMQKAHVLACASAWNAYYREEERNYVKPGSVVNFYLLGTPWDGK